MHRASRWWVAAVLALLLFPLGGCGGVKDKPQPVHGKVTFQGKPVAAGMIRFSSSRAGVDMTASLQSDGDYAIVTAKGAGLPEGTYQIAVTPPHVEIALGPMKQMPTPRSCPNIPERYRDPSTSGLTLAVKAGDNCFDVKMQP